MMWSGKGWCPEGLLEGLEPQQFCCNQVFSRKLWHLQLEEKQWHIRKMRLHGSSI